MKDETLRDLLEKAAKVARVEVVRPRLDDPMNRDFLVQNSRRNPHQKVGPWAPHADDGDSRRLQVACGLALVPFGDAMAAMHNESGRSWAERYDAHCGDSCAAARMAVLRAAAAIGEAMP